MPIVPDEPTAYNISGKTVFLTRNQVDEILTAALALSVAYYTSSASESISDEANDLCEAFENAEVLQFQ